jgi:hypothetical protein
LAFLGLLFGFGFAAQAARPEPTNWFVGDMHVHRSCGGTPEAVSSTYSTMVSLDLTVISLLADSGNGEVQDPTTDLPKVTGADDPVSTSNRLVHWDSEWHWDATYTQYAHQALGGHLVLLGLTNAQQLWAEYTYPILNWARQQGGIGGFAHFQYLPESSFPDTLTCCTPIEYPVEVALGGCDFISEDVAGANAAILAYYRLLNCGFRPGWAGGSDHPCSANIGSVVTFAAVDGPLTYRKWIEAIRAGHTVVSRNGRNEFVDLKVNGTARPGDVINLPAGGGAVTVSAQWSALQNLTGTIELVQNGVMVTNAAASVTTNTTSSLSATLNFTRSGWLAARRMSGSEHMVQTAAVFINVTNTAVRASAADAQFYVSWMDELLSRTDTNGVWGNFFQTNRVEARARYQMARDTYQQIADEAAALDPLTITTTALPLALSNAFYSATLQADGGALPYTWSLLSGALPAGLTLNTNSGVISGVPAGLGSNSFTVQASDASGTPQVASQALGLAVLNSLSSPGLIGNTNNGASVDNIWSGGAWINASRFQAASNLTVTAIYAKVGAINGRYKCAIYSDSGAQPSRLLGYTAEVVNPAAGWQTFFLNAPQSLTNGNYYWLAIWSDNPSAGVYYSDSSGNLRWGQYNYGAWPDPIATSGGGSLKYCIYATGGSLPPGPLVVISVSPAGGAAQVQVGTKVQAVFNRALNPLSLTPNSFSLVDAASNAVPATVSYNSSNNTAVLTPASPLVGPATYVARLAGGPSGVADGFGVTLTNDYVWTFTTGVPDYTPPTVIATRPDSGANNGNLGGAVTVLFSEAVDATSVTTNTFSLRNSTNGLVPASVFYSSSLRTATLIPSKLLATNAAYTATVKGGAAGVKDLAGNPLAADYVWSFTTVSPNPYGNGPGGPILVVTSTTNAFSTYYAEILLAEGLNSFAIQDVGSVTSNTLANYSVVLLGNMALTAGQTTMFSNWVAGGGSLVAMKPDKKLAPLLGLVDASSTVSEGYLLVNTNSGPGAGIVGQTMQFHGTADRYTLNGATSVATLYTNATNATASPAATLRAVGANGGKAAAFTYDLARSIVLTRQGNPAWINQNRDAAVTSDAVVRSDDLFYGNFSGDVKPDWVNVGKLAIPQADEQQRLLANLILQLNMARQPLPRFWYFPNGNKAAIVMTGDDHGNNGTAGRFDRYLALSPTNSSFYDWQTVRGSSYMFPSTPISDSQAAAYVAQGFEIGLHLNTGCSNYTQAAFTTFLTNQLATFRAAYPSLPSPTTHRIHCIAWSGYTIAPEVEFNNGIRFNVSYYHYPPAWIGNTPGFMTGSGMPMRFANTNGVVVNVYQAATQMTDESGQTYPDTVNALLDRAVGAEGYYGAFVANMHNDTNPSPGAEAIVSSAQARGVPVVSADQMFAWVEARNRSYMTNMAWGGNVLTFSVQADSFARGLQTLVPVPSGLGVMRVTSNSVPVAYAVQQIKGMQYAQFPVGDGNYEVDYTTDLVPPAVVSVTPASGATGVNLDTMVQIVFSEAVDPATLGTNTVTLVDSLASPVALTLAYDPGTFRVTATPAAPLRAGRSYTATVAGGASGVKDLVGNAMAGNYQWSFAVVSNAVPVASNLVAVTLEDTATNLFLPGSDLNNPITYAILAPPANGTVTALNTNTGALTYSPVTHYFGPDGFTYRVSDGSLYATGSVSITVTAVNYPPTATNLNLVVPEDTATNFFLLGGDVEYAVTYGILLGPAHGTLSGLNTNTGAISYHPNADYFGADSFQYQVSDGSLYATGLVSIVVTAVDDPPVFLMNPTNQTIPELTLLVVTNAAVDVDTPASLLTYVLVNPPTNAVISTNGVITWTPSEEQGPSTNEIVTVVSDQTSSVTNRFEVIVTEVNQPPVFVATPADCTIPELTLLTVTNAATDADIPANVLSYALVNPPAGAVIDASGVITWTPSEAQGPSTNQIVTVVSDGMAWVTNAFVVVVTEVNQPPVFVATPTNCTIAELTLLTVTNSATDADIPANVLSYTLVNPPAGAVIDASGVITWTPSLVQGPSTNLMVTVVSDGMAWVTNAFEVVVTQLDTPPLFKGAPTNVTIPELTLLCVTNTATAAYQRGSVLSYALVNPPAGAAIDGAGVITWTPTEAQGPSTNQVITVVSDGTASATNSFEVVVTEVNQPPVFVATPANVTIPVLTLLTVTNAATDADIPANVLTYALVNPPAGAAIDAGGVITWTPTEAQGPSTNEMVTVVSDGMASVTNSFEVAVTAPLEPPTILSISLNEGQVAITWSTRAGQSYVLEYTDLLPSTNWTPVVPAIVATNTTATATVGVEAVPLRLYRVRAP